MRLRKLSQYLLLPPEISDFERRYLARMNRIALVFFALHAPAFALIALLNDTRPGIAIALSLGVLAGPTFAYFTVQNPRSVATVYGVTAMLFGGLLVHFGQGPVQIEMHFYFFALIAMAAVFGNPVVIMAAAATVALHHLVVWLVLPGSVFNYQAAWWVVAVHAAFVVLESAAACFIARSFFDNVIGLEKIVRARTAEVEAKNRDMRLLLDNVSQGFLTIDLEGRLAPERSAAADAWFGAPASGELLFDYLARVSPSFAERSRLGWDEVKADIMPIELTLEQMPQRLVVGGSYFEIKYRPIGAEAPFGNFLVVITDVTTQVAREQAEIERLEAMAVFERVLNDRASFETFYEEATAIVDALTHGKAEESVVKRLLHTMKGNASIFGLQHLAGLCHDLESRIAETGELPTGAHLEPLATRWGRLTRDVEKLLGTRSRAIEIESAQYMALERAVKNGESGAALLERVRGLRLEPTRKRLRVIAEQAQRISERLEKGRVRVTIEDHDVRLDDRRWRSFWNAFIHAIRNAVDHGIESREARRSLGKREEGEIILSTREDGDNFIVEIADDGHGVDWDLVREKAQRAGLATASGDDLKRALFVDGMTTASTVSDVSGRGVGMGALLHATRALGGEIDIATNAGAGTTLRMTFPLAASHTVDSLAPAAA